MKILVTGASGFIGSFVVEEAIKRGLEVWAGIRKSSSRQWLTDPRIHFIEFDLTNIDHLKADLQHFKESNGKWDYIVHAAGVTKTLSEKTFMKANFEGTRNLVLCLRELDMTPKRLIFMSSLSVLGNTKQDKELQIDGHYYEELNESDSPDPNTDYARSKLSAENFLLQQWGFPVTILRPTGVYGPREKDYFLMVQCIKKGWDFKVGFEVQEITFLYIRDLVDAIFIALEKGQNGEILLLSDGRTYQSSEFSQLIQEELGIAKVHHFTAPCWFLKSICVVSELIGRIRRKTSTLNIDKYHILKQRNWRCNITQARNLGFKPKYDLKAGVKETVAWYQKEKWI